MADKGTSAAMPSNWRYRRVTCPPRAWISDTTRSYGFAARTSTRIDGSAASEADGCASCHPNRIKARTEALIVLLPALQRRRVAYPDFRPGTKETCRTPPAPIYKRMTTGWRRLRGAWTIASTRRTPAWYCNPARPTTGIGSWYSAAQLLRVAAHPISSANAAPGLPSRRSFGLRRDPCTQLRNLRGGDSATFAQCRAPPGRPLPRREHLRGVQRGHRPRRHGLRAVPAPVFAGPENRGPGSLAAAPSK